MDAPHEFYLLRTGVDQAQMDRLAGHVGVMLRADNRLRQYGSVWVDHHPSSISAFLVREGRVIEATIDDPSWWDPPNIANGTALASRLVSALREQDSGP